MENIEEMPHPHDKPVTTEAELIKILWYNLNDCQATLKLYNHSITKDLLEVRKWAVKTYENPAILNMSNSSMGEAIFRHMLEKEGPIAKPHPPREFYLKEIILPYVKFKTPHFDKVLETIKNKLVNGVTDSMDIECVDNGLVYKFGLGGLHAARENSIHHNIRSIDVTSFYPNIAIKNHFFPRHLSRTFVDVYEDIFKQRLTTKKGSPMNKAYKETLNSCFGKSNSEYSFLYDPQFLYSITINGQLLLAMLCEKISLTCGKVIMTNTDGIEVEVSDNKMFDEVCKKWEKFTMLQLEYNTYDKIMIRDCNNYIASTPDLPSGKPFKDRLKVKGAYELDKEFHKDNSMAIVPLAVAYWFSKEECSVPELLYFIRNADLKDFFMYARAKTSKFIVMKKDGYRVDIPKTVRYIITKDGYTLVRVSDKKVDKIHKDVFVCILNDMTIPDPSEEQLKKLIDYSWYMREVQKLIVVKSKTPTLF